MIFNPFAPPDAPRCITGGISGFLCFGVTMPSLELSRLKVQPIGPFLHDFWPQWLFDRPKNEIFGSTSRYKDKLQRKPTRISELFVIHCSRKVFSCCCVLSIEKLWLEKEILEWNRPQNSGFNIRILSYSRNSGGSWQTIVFSPHLERLKERTTNTFKNKLNQLCQRDLALISVSVL